MDDHCSDCTSCRVGVAGYDYCTPRFSLIQYQSLDRLYLPPREAPKYQEQGFIMVSGLNPGSFVSATITKDRCVP